MSARERPCLPTLTCRPPLTATFLAVRDRPADAREIDAAFASAKADGGRMTEERMKVVDEPK